MNIQATVGCVQPALFVGRQNWPAERLVGCTDRTVSPLFVCYSQLDEGFPENGHPPQLRVKLCPQLTIIVPE